MGPNLRTSHGSSGTGREPEWDPALLELYSSRYVELVRIAYLIVGNRSVAEEVTQEAFIRCQQRWSQVVAPFPYVRTAVVNGARSWTRRQEVERRHQPLPPDPALLEPDELWDALSQLNERCRTAIVLRFYECLPDEEIAEILGCRRATVRTSIHRGLKHLQGVIPQ